MATQIEQAPSTFSPARWLHSLVQIGGGYAGPGRSPDRADACVWALSELLLGRRGTAQVRLP